MQGILKICQLPSMNYDNDWATYKVLLFALVACPIPKYSSITHKCLWTILNISRFLWKGLRINYHADANLYAVIVSSQVSLFLIYIWLHVCSVRLYLGCFTLFSRIFCELVSNIWVIASKFCMRVFNNAQHWLWFDSF